ncbi:MAG: hypothetical protein K1X79_09280 [Oligoflexia bacterium]|nr:hypothetical protein [Oligoflexia bacterium]
MTSWEGFSDSDSSDKEVLAKIETLRAEIRHSIELLLASPNVPEEIKIQLRIGQPADSKVN